MFIPVRVIHAGILCAAREGRLEESDNAACSDDQRRQEQDTKTKGTTLYYMVDNDRIGTNFTDILCH